jgi:protein phosphatase
MKSFKATDIGRRRQFNEDYIFSSDTGVGRLGNLYLLADGMGGHAGGQIASKYAVEDFVGYIVGSDEPNPVAALNNAVNFVNSQIENSSAHTIYEGMGTTLVGAVVSGTTLNVVNVGDSRLYLMSGSLRQITKDHSWVQEMMDLGRLEKDSEIYQENKNVITRAIGVYDSVSADLFEVELKPGDTFLLCSDGLTNLVSDADIEKVLTSPLSLEEKCMLLIDIGLEAGGMDNISVILVDPEISEVRAC